TPGAGTGGAFAEQVVAAGWLLPSAVPGVYARSGHYEGVARGLEQSLEDLGAGRFEVVYVPPILPRAAFDKSDYLRSFPHLMGSLHVFGGDERAHAELVNRYEAGAGWEELLQPAETVLSSAACHAVYPHCSGRLPAAGRRIEVSGFCFRHEPSTDPARMQSFRMHEFVCVDEPETALEHRNAFLDTGLQFLADLGLELRCEVASDPFFGRIGTLLAETQLVETAKIEGLAPVTSEVDLTAVISGNYALDHFTSAFDIQADDGGKVHSSCVAFGVDRVVLALVRRHGTEAHRWPPSVRRLLGL
ncbi:MAG TPA: hypothetical protein VMB72_00190, partial [Acidimicrobiales bacterium]|nr:hypothetical protein [Acidimicrobiales bacterium]